MLKERHHRAGSGFPFVARIAVAMALVAIACLVLAPPVLAHAILLRSEPSDGAVLDEAPREVRLWFSEAVAPELSSARLLDGGGRSLGRLPLQAHPVEQGLVVLSLPEIGPGLYSVAWKVLSNDDAHFREGLLVFRVGAGPEPVVGASITDRAGTAPVSAQEVALRWLRFALLAVLLGGLAVVRLVFRGAVGPEGLASRVRPAAGRVLEMARWAAVLAVLVNILLLARQAGSLAGSTGEPVGAVAGQLLSRTLWGVAWLGQQAVLVAVAGALRLARLRGAGPAAPSVSVAGILALAVCVLQAISSHAGGLTRDGVLAVTTDALHLAAASVWVGGLVTLMVVLRPLARAGAASRAMARACWRRFGWVAGLSVGVLTATGLYSMGRQVASTDALATTFYGRALVGKVALALATAGLGLINAVALRPSVSVRLGRLLGRSGPHRDGSSRLPRLVGAEVALGLLVLLGAGVLTAAPPARGLGAGSVPGPTSRSRSVDDLLVTLSAKPNEPGDNLFTVLAVTTRRPPLAEVTGVDLRFSSPGSAPPAAISPMVEVEPGRFQVSGGYLNARGSWRVDVLVRREGFPDTVVAFDWAVGVSVPAGDDSIPGPFERALTMAATLVLLSVVLGAAAAWFIRPRPGGSGPGDESDLPPPREAGSGARSDSDSGRLVAERVP